LSVAGAVLQTAPFSKGFIITVLAASKPTLKQQTRPNGRILLFYLEDILSSILVL